MTNPTPIQVAIVDDHTMLVEALVERLNADPGLRVVLTADNGDDGLRGILQTGPDVAVLDLELPGRGAFDVAGEIHSRQKQTRVLFLTGYLSDVFVEQALKCNAYGYLLKGEPVDRLIACIKRVASGERCFSPDVESKLHHDPARNRYTMRSESALSQLTNRQLEVLRHLARGESVKEVAKSLQLSQKSVDSHKYRIMHKLGIHDRVKLTRYAIREGLMLP
jgi:DNA-binding NarL/FixJ family response regulator